MWLPIRLNCIRLFYKETVCISVWNAVLEYYCFLCIWKTDNTTYCGSIFTPNPTYCQNFFENCTPFVFDVLIFLFLDYNKKYIVHPFFTKIFACSQKIQPILVSWLLVHLTSFILGMNIISEKQQSSEMSLLSLLHEILVCSR